MLVLPLRRKKNLISSCFFLRANWLHSHARLTPLSTLKPLFACFLALSEKKKGIGILQGHQRCRKSVAVVEKFRRQSSGDDGTRGRIEKENSFCLSLSPPSSP
jgi:hypothetical protein